MAKRKVQFQKGYSLFEFLKGYGTEAQCENALFTWRFPHGFVYPDCTNKTRCHLKIRLEIGGVSLLMMCQLLKIAEGNKETPLGARLDDAANQSLWILF